MKILNRWLPALTICVLIYYSSARHGTPVSSDYVTNYVANKAAHVLVFATLCLAFYRGTKNVLLAVLLTILYGVTDEIHQQFTPTRTGQLWDVAIDASAAAFVGLILWKFYQNLPKKLKNWLEK